ncbi:MAG: undecaprenyl-diphosphate phosphatase [Endomicrobia bacterium]|nr:undecaprenyl-diphosphate phosphatase [Endomicrobiia bacterium]MCL2506949.1 undecaprenyl-diphosphate phosphatase [Endomicrobiia bacterium]
MEFIEIVKVVIIGIIQGVTEWLPISSTGHMILADEFIHLNITEAFKEMFLVVIQFGSILAVVVLYWKRLLPVSFENKKIAIKKETIIMWLKIAVSCVPAAVIGVLFDKKMNELFYNYTTVAIMLILFGIFFIIVENRNKNVPPKINSIAEITFMMAFVIGLFQLIAAVFPGTSRSGSTIIGGLILGISRTVAAEYTFFLAVPVMFGASALKLSKFGMNFTAAEAITLILGMVIAFVVSIVTIRFLLGYVKKHDFKAFGWYRIALGLLVLGYFFTYCWLVTPLPCQGEVG